jgi:hydrophobic/amphiphilic exporter-1 (mainly G- bacteria), HAE1 family
MQYIVKGVSMLRDKEDFENLIVGYKATSVSTAGETNIERAPIFLKDVATVTYGNKDPFNIVHINGERCVGLSDLQGNKIQHGKIG